MTKIANELAHKASSIVLLDKEVIKRDQDVIRGNLLSLDSQIHNNAVQCLLHCSIHGDSSLMTRLLTEVVDAKTGYRRAGLINWIRKFSPMELQGTKIVLSGTINQAGIEAMVKQFPEIDRGLFTAGAKRPFLVEYANKTPFTSDADNAERVAKPIFKDTLMSKVDTMYKEIIAAAENTVNGKPVDVSKPFYDGIHMDTVVDFAKKVKEMRDALPADETRAVRLAQKQQKELGEFIDANAKAVNVA